MKVDLYGFKLRYNHKKGDLVIWNKVIFKCCPFNEDVPKIVDEIRKETKDFIGVKGIRNWWNWWELVPTIRHKKLIYWVKFYCWYWIRYKRLQREIDNLD